MPRAGQDPDRVEAGGHEVVAYLGRRSDDRAQVGGEALGPAEEGADARVEGGGDTAHRRLDVRTHPVPVGLQRRERGVAGDAVDLPGCTHRLEQPDHQPADLFPVVAVVAGVLDHGPRRIEPFHLFGDQVVVLGGLERDRDARPFAQLAGPHAGGVDDVLALDRAPIGDDAAHGAVFDQDVLDGDALDDRHPPLAGAASERHRGVDRVDPSVALDVKPGQQVVGAGEREQVGHLARRDLVNVDTAVAVECGHSTVFLQAAVVGRHFDESDRLEPGRQPGLGLEPGVEVAGVLAQLGRCLRCRPERHHQPCGVPRGARSELIALDQHGVGPAQVSEVIGDRRADHPAPDDHDPGS